MSLAHWQNHTNHLLSHQSKGKSMWPYDPSLHPMMKDWPKNKLFQRPISRIGPTTTRSPQNSRTCSKTSSPSGASHLYVRTTRQASLQKLKISRVHSLGLWCTFISNWSTTPSEARGQTTLPATPSAQSQHRSRFLSVAAKSHAHPTKASCLKGHQSFRVRQRKKRIKQMPQTLSKQVMCFLHPIHPSC